MYDSTKDTQKHIEQVRQLLFDFCSALERRALVHDASKLKPPEKEAFDMLTPELAIVEYGSEQYRTLLREMQPTIDHHYQANDHHPEHFKNGVEDMTLMALVEMFCDWKAASLRHSNDSFRSSLEHNRERFGLSDQLYKIFCRTAEAMDW